MVENVEGSRLKRLGTVKDRYGEYGEQPLHLAAENGHLAVVQFLVEDCHVNMHQATHDGRTPLHIAASNGMTDITMYLLSYADGQWRKEIEHKPVPTGTITYSRLYSYHITKDHSGKTYVDTMNLQHKLDFLTCQQMQDFSVERLMANDYHLFFLMIQQDEPPAWAIFGSGGEFFSAGAALMDGDSESFGVIDVNDFFTETRWHHSDKYKILLKMVKQLICDHPELAFARDANGRIALDVASKVNETDHTW